MGYYPQVRMYTRCHHNTEKPDSYAFGVDDVAGASRFSAHAPWSDKVLFWDYGPTPNGRISTDYTNYLNKWTHVALVSNGSSFKAIYLDGKLITSGVASGGSATALTGLRIASSPETPADLFHKGRIDDFRIYNRVLSADEVKRLYNMGK
jgi:hypothetical protein